MLADGIDPIGAKNQAKTEALIKGRTFESVALDWHTEMSAKWAPDYSKTVMSRLKTHLFPLIGARAIVDLDTHDLMQPLEAIKKRGTIDVALRVQNYLQSIMRKAKRLRLITVNPAYDLEGAIKAPRVVHRPALPLSRLPELQERIDTYRLSIGRVDHASLAEQPRRENFRGAPCFASMTRCAATWRNINRSQNHGVSPLLSPPCRHAPGQQRRGLSPLSPLSPHHP